MDPYKDKTLRMSYYSKITKKPKHKQVKVKDYANEEEAKIFLENWKKESLENEAKLLEPVIDFVDMTKLTDAIIEEQKPTLQPLPTVKFTKFVLSTPNFKTDGNGKSTVLLAASNGGKTTLMKYIIDKWFDNKNVITTLMSPSINAAIYKDIIKNKNIITSEIYIEELIKDVARIQRKLKNKYNFAFFMDDIIDAKGSEALLKMFLTYRNLNMSSFINLQDCKLLSRSIRHNANNFIFLRQNTQDAISDILDLFLNSYEPFMSTDKHNRIELYRELTKDNRFIYLNALDNIISFHEAVPI